MNPDRQTRIARMVTNSIGENQRNSGQLRSGSKCRFARQILRCPPESFSENGRRFALIEQYRPSPVVAYPLLNRPQMNVSPYRAGVAMNAQAI
jgi:hypothetical protein